MRSIIRSIPVFSHYLKKFESFIAESGWPLGVKEFADYYHVPIEVSIEPETISIIKSKGIILIGNHPHEAEPLFLMATLPERDHIFWISNANMQGFSLVLDPLIIPVYTNSRKSGTSSILMVNLFKHFHTNFNHLSYDEEHHRNIDSISNAANKVLNGSLVVIYPDRKAGIGKWMDGVGYLIRQSTPSSARVVFSYIKNTTRVNYLRVFPLVNRLLPKIKVFYAKPISTTEFTNIPPKEITVLLKKEYDKWVETLF